MLVRNLLEPARSALEHREFLADQNPQSAFGRELLEQNPALARFFRPYDRKGLRAIINEMSEALVLLGDFLSGNVRAYRPKGDDYHIYPSLAYLRPLQILRQAYATAGDAAPPKACEDLGRSADELLRSIHEMISPAKVPGGPLQGTKPTFTYNTEVPAYHLDLRDARTEAGIWAGQFLARIGRLRAAIVEAGRARLGQELDFPEAWAGTLLSTVDLLDLAGTTVARLAAEGLRALPQQTEANLVKRSGILGACYPSASAVYNIGEQLRGLGIQGQGREPVVMTDEETRAAQTKANGAHEAQRKLNEAEDAARAEQISRQPEPQKN